MIRRPYYNPLVRFEGVSVIESAVVRFAQGHTVALVRGQRQMDAQGYDLTRRGVANFPNRFPVRVEKLGHGLWRETR